VNTTPRIALALAVACSLAVGGAVAEDPAPAGSGLGQAVQSEAKKVEQQATGGAKAQPIGGLESALGMLHANDAVATAAAKLAATHASSSKVKQLASKLGLGQGTVDKALVALASARGLNLDNGAADQQKSSGLAALDGLAKLKGASFDKSFMSWLVGNQEQSVDRAKQAQAQAKQGGDTGLSSLLGKMVPQLQSHLQSAKRVQASVGAPRQARSAS
jgi:putative membrane protein